MIELEAEVAVLGAGFGGSLLAQLPAARTILVERGRHPRFAIGESSTPLADMKLRELAQTHHLKRLAPLAKYGTWKQTYPHISCGLKRGFSYFSHVAGQPFQTRADHANELLVEASSSDATGDTHWYRPEVDQFLADEARAAGVTYLDEITLETVGEQDDAWRLNGRRGDEPVRIRAIVLLDATGEGGLLARHLRVPVSAEGMRTRSRAIYGHFTGVRRFRDQLAARGGKVHEHPFRADDAAMHHLIDGGWMWVLRFDNGITSAGFALDVDVHPLDELISADDEWARLMARYPPIAEQFAEAKLVAPPEGLRRTGRLQRRADRLAGDFWAMLPGTAGFIDPLHSTGIAHTLYGIDRIGRIFDRHWMSTGFEEAWRVYERQTLAELDLMDLLVHGCYLALPRFELFTHYAMWYFAAATMCEHRRRRGLGEKDLFLRADDRQFVGQVERSYDRLLDFRRQGGWSDSEVAAFCRDTTAALAPYNVVGLADPAKHNMYGYR